MKPKSNKPPPSPLEAHLGFWLRFVSNHASTRFQQQLEAKGVTFTEWVVADHCRRQRLDVFSRPRRWAAAF